MQDTNIMKEIRSWFITLGICIAAVLILNNYVIVNAKIPSESMESTLEPGDRVIASRLAYISSEPQRGDIVIFKYPVDDALGITKLYIKRIIGLPGETVEIKNAGIYIDGSDIPLDETYLKEEWIRRNDGLTFHVPEGHYFMLGDNRNNSSDSRYWPEEAIQKGLTVNLEEAEKYSYVSREKILGKASFRYWPLNEITGFD
ncbi:signal peptidase I [Ruminococcus sp. 5_1_39BFAA]|uniref:signal peptidase I n=1 Tax=Ruminococcus sp. 5_1_39BFAA TaxID=457412 RepID=UPI00356548A6